LLWSAQFEATDYIRDVEVTSALKRAEKGDAIIVSIVLERCGWKRHPVAKYEVLPPKGRPVRDRKPIRNAWHEVGEGMRMVLEHLAKTRNG
jgi:hypothetical protein